MDSDAAFKAASSKFDAKSISSDTPLVAQRKWIRTHAWIQGLTLILLVSIKGCVKPGPYTRAVWTLNLLGHRAI